MDLKIWSFIFWWSRFVAKETNGERVAHYSTTNKFVWKLYTLKASQIEPVSGISYSVKAPLQIVHTDFYGPIKTTPLDSNVYFLNFKFNL